MAILGIETSCDETAAAVVDNDGRLIAHVIRSQISEHQPYGGVVPEIAARAHIACIDAVIAETLKQAGDTKINAVAATAGPGLIGGVTVGCMYGKGFAAAKQLPFYAVDHLEAHALTVRMTQAGKGCTFPFLLFLLSGGHCRIGVVNGIGDFTLYGATRDDAVGECFDKVAKMLGLPYPGGPEIERLALQGNANAFDFTEPLRGTPGCDMSLSGLKTAVRYAIRDAGDGAYKNDVFRADICASFQRVICGMLRRRAGFACRRFREEYGEDARSMAVAGGVAANQALKQMFEEASASAELNLYIAPPALCTDNGAMIAWAGVEYRAAHVLTGEHTAMYARDALRRRKKK